MKLNNKGFALTSILYMLISLFLMVMLLILANLAQRKVVLDKIKYDVKDKLNQGGISVKGTYVVTLDPLGGQMGLATSKRVKYNDLYGELPTPIKSGYTFTGWRKEPAIYTYHYMGYTESANTLTLSPGSSYITPNQVMEVGDTLLFDITYENADLVGIVVSNPDSNDANYYVDSSKYNVSEGHAWGEIWIDSSMIHRFYEDGETTGYWNFIDFVFNDTPSNFDPEGPSTFYTVNKFKILKPSDRISPDSLVTTKQNHTLYASWRATTDVDYDQFYVAPEISNNQTNNPINDPSNDPINDSPNNTDYLEQYDSLSYIRSTGNQFIILDYAAKTNTEVRLDIELIENSETAKQSYEGYSNIIGRQEITNNKNVLLCNIDYDLEDYNKIYYYVDKAPEENGVTGYYKEYSSVTNRSTMTIKSGSATFQGQTLSVATKTADNADNMVILGSYNNDVGLVPFDRYDVKIYRIKIYEGNSLIMDFVPVKQKASVFGTEYTGLYDVINDTFYDSDGAIDFSEN